jgi:hypothetical protein
MDNIHSTSIIGNTISDNYIASMNNFFFAKVKKGDFKLFSSPSFEDAFNYWSAKPVILNLIAKITIFI